MLTIDIFHPQGRSVGSSPGDFPILGVWLWLGLGLLLGPALVLIGIELELGRKIAPVMYIYPSRTEYNNEQCLLLTVLFTPYCNLGLRLGLGLGCHTNIRYC